MKKAKRIAALIGVILLLAMYGSTMVFALIKSPHSKGLLMASIFCTIAVPVILYAMSLVAKLLKNKAEQMKKEEEHMRRRAAEMASADTSGDEADDSVPETQTDTQEDQTDIRETQSAGPDDAPDHDGQ